MKCPACGHEFPSPVAQAGGRAGGKARVPKGFANAAVLKKAIRTRERNKAEEFRQEALERARRKALENQQG